MNINKMVLLEIIHLKLPEKSAIIGWLRKYVHI